MVGNRVLPEPEGVAYSASQTLAGFMWPVCGRGHRRDGEKRDHPLPEIPGSTTLIF